MQTVKIKQQTDDFIEIEGDAVIFGYKDTDDEYFDETTNFYLKNYQNAPLFYDHTQGAFRAKIGDLTSLRKETDRIKYTAVIPTKFTNDEEVLQFYNGESSRAELYAQAIVKLIEDGKLGSSSGTLAHVARKSADGKIEDWPIGELSLTPIPAEFRTKGDLRVIKQLAGDASLKTLLPETWIKQVAQDVTDETPAVEVLKDYSTNGETKMSEETQAVVKDEWRETFEAQVKTQGEQLNRMLDLLENSPANKKAMSTRSDKTTKYTAKKSLGDAALALRKGEWDYLKSVYDFQKTTMIEGTGALGGFTVPEEWLPGVYDFGSMQNQIVALCTTIPNAGAHGRFPVLDVFDAPSTSDTAFAGGLSSTVVGEDAAFTETNLNFEEVTWNLNKNGGVISISNELLADSPDALEAMIRRKIELTVTSKNQYWILRGSGAGEPLGILNSGAAIAVNVDTDNTFAYADALEMTTRFKSMGGSGVWIIHPSVMAEIGVFESSAGGGVFQANYQSPLGNTLLGKPIIVSEYMPGAGGDRVILADLSAYYRWTKGGVMLAVSEHAEFTSDNIVYRFKERVDGKPLMRTAITLSDGAGTYTVSPFVYLND